MKINPIENISAAETTGSTPLSESLPTGFIYNWAGNIAYSTNKIYYPKNLAELQDLVVKHPKLKVLGTRHCFNRIADSEDFFISTNELNQVLALDSEAGTVTVVGGIKYGELSPFLDQ